MAYGVVGVVGESGLHVSALGEVGYDGPVIMEPYQALIRSAEALMRSVSYMRCIMEDNGGQGVKKDEQD